MTVVDEEQDRVEKQYFQKERIESMSDQEYLAFHQCRQTNFLSRGRNLLCDWLQLRIESIKSKDLELFAYLLRVLLSRLVE